MDQKIFIFGTSHKYQWPDPGLPKHQIIMFETKLRKLCKKFSIRAISEENSLEAQKEYNPHSIPYEIAEL